MRTTDYTETRHQPMMLALYAAAQQGRAPQGQGWYTAPTPPARELTDRPAPKDPHREVARTSDGAPALTRDFTRLSPGADVADAPATLTADRPLITRHQPNRSSRRKPVITDGGPLPAKGA